MAGLKKSSAMTVPSAENPHASQIFQFGFRWQAHTTPVANAIAAAADIAVPEAAVAKASIGPPATMIRFRTSGDPDKDNQDDAKTGNEIENAARAPDCGLPSTAARKVVASVNGGKAKRKASRSA